MFAHLGCFVYPKDICSENDIFDIAIEADTENVEITDESYELYCLPEKFSTIRDALNQKFEHTQPSMSRLLWKPSPDTIVKVEDYEQAIKMVNLTNTLEQQDDVQYVTSNHIFSDDVMTKLLENEEI